MVKCHVQPVRYLDDGLLKRLWIEVRHRHGDPDNRAEQAQNRYGPDDDSHHGVGAVHAHAFELFQMAQMLIERVGRTFASYELERVAKPPDDVRLLNRRFFGQLVEQPLAVIDRLSPGWNGV